MNSDKANNNSYIELMFKEKFGTRRSYSFEKDMSSIRKQNKENKFGTRRSYSFEGDMSSIRKRNKKAVKPRMAEGSANSLRSGSRHTIPSRSNSGSRPRRQSTLERSVKPEKQGKRSPRRNTTPRLKENRRKSSLDASLCSEDTKKEEQPARVISDVDKVLLLPQAALLAVLQKSESLIASEEPLFPPERSASEDNLMVPSMPPLFPERSDSVRNLNLPARSAKSLRRLQTFPPNPDTSSIDSSASTRRMRCRSIDFSNEDDESCNTAAIIPTEALAGPVNPWIAQLGSPKRESNTTTSASRTGSVNPKGTRRTKPNSRFAKSA